MYNFFMLIGKVESIEKGAINLAVNSKNSIQHLYILVSFEMPETLIKGNTVGVKGEIREDGLYAEKIIFMKKEELETA